VDNPLIEAYYNNIFTALANLPWFTNFTPKNSLSIKPSTIAVVLVLLAFFHSLFTTATFSFSIISAEVPLSVILFIF
jgi:PKD repeat protein